MVRLALTGICNARPGNRNVLRRNGGGGGPEWKRNSVKRHLFTSQDAHTVWRRRPGISLAGTSPENRADRDGGPERCRADSGWHRWYRRYVRPRPYRFSSGWAHVCQSSIVLDREAAGVG